MSRSSISLALVSAVALAWNAAPQSHANVLGRPMSLAQHKQMLAQVSDRNPDKRMIASLMIRAEGDLLRSEYKAALEKQREVVEQELQRAQKLYRATDSAVVQLRNEIAEWKGLADAARVLVQTDHHKDGKKFAEMDKAFAAAERAHSRLLRKVRPQQTSGFGPLIDTLHWLAEINREISWCNKSPDDGGPLSLAVPLVVLGAPEEITSFARELEPLIGVRESVRRVSAAHSLMGWAKPEQVQYANLLNGRRAVLGLRPLLLAEKLSDACFQHSDEMVRMKYFAHESPVPENKSPGDRVRNAGFEGGFAGECIYAGSGSPNSAHQGWWYSDGHRLILYASGPAAQGIARAGGGTWTFLTGHFRRWPL